MRISILCCHLEKPRAEVETRYSYTAISENYLIEENWKKYLEQPQRDLKRNNFK